MALRGTSLNRKLDLRLFDLTVAIALRIVIVDQADSLHERITDCRTDEFKAAFEQVFTERVRDLGARGEWLVRLSFQWLAVDEPPDVGVEAAELALHFEKGDGVGDGGVDLETIADDTVVIQQRRDLLLVVTRDFLRVETDRKSTRLNSRH